MTSICTPDDVDPAVPTGGDVVQPPTPGRTVLYRLSKYDVEAIDRLHPMATADRPAARRNSVREGDVYPAMIVRVFSPSIQVANLQVFLDGDVSYWATSRAEGHEPCHWTWPARS